MRVKMSKQPPPAPTASAVSPCPTNIQIVGRPGTGRLPRAIASPDLYGKWLFSWLSLVMSLMVSYFVLSFFPRDVLDEIWD